MVITFDHHPDEVLTGSAPPLLLDPDERLARLAAAGVDGRRSSSTSTRRCGGRRTTRSSSAIRAPAPLAGFLMTPDAAFGFERRGTPEALAALGARAGSTSSSCRRSTLDGAVGPELGHPGGDRAGDLADGGASCWAGRRRGCDRRRGRRPDALGFDWPWRCRPTATTRSRSTAGDRCLELVGGDAYLLGEPSNRRVTVVLEPSAVGSRSL